MVSHPKGAYTPFHTVSRLCIFHKIYHYCRNIRASLLTPLNRVYSRLNNTATAKCVSYRRASLSALFVAETVVDWEGLSSPIAIMEDPSKFGNAALEFLFPVIVPAATRRWTFFQSLRFSFSLFLSGPRIFHFLYVSLLPRLDDAHAPLM